MSKYHDSIAQPQVVGLNFRGSQARNSKSQKSSRGSQDEQYEELQAIKDDGGRSVRTRCGPSTSALTGCPQGSSAQASSSQKASVNIVYTAMYFLIIRSKRLYYVPYAGGASLSVGASDGERASPRFGSSGSTNIPPITCATAGAGTRMS